MRSNDRKNRKSQGPLNRRAALKQLGAGLTVTSFGTGIVGASGSDYHNSEEYLDKIIEQARQIRQKTGSQERYLNHIRKSELATHRRWGTYEVPPLSSSDVSTEELAKSYFHHELTLSYTCDPDVLAFDYRWEHENVCPSNLRDGEDPRDVAALHWQTDDYTYKADSKVVGYNTYLDKDDGDIETNGLAAEYDDAQDSYEETNRDGACGVTVDSFLGGKVYIENDDDPRTRAWNMDYYHYYKNTNCSIDSVSLSSTGGISVSFSCSKDVANWHIQGYQEEDTADEGCCPDCTQRA